MKKYRISIIVTFIIVTIIIISALLVNMCLDPFYRPDKEKMEKYFKRDRDDIIIIVDYFSNNSSSSIIFNHPNIKANTDRFKVDDDIVLEAINILLNERGYSVIGKRENTIYFQKWTRGANLGIGISYSINKEDKPIIDHITKLEPLSESGWYFYEEDFEEWKLNH